MHEAQRHNCGHEEPSRCVAAFASPKPEAVAAPSPGAQPPGRPTSRAVPAAARPNGFMTAAC
ncbi:hypothetical protein CHLRE_09g401775v5 [Chlamydomonas reinhardtii]|uniref:Uncharacterized protein n=1 Tax=Chlamydomonas reinhardtii TaxID=3055 RepID=A0A2K3DF13_CHLRE|nr:uncharacterized protein CHLRE_09g401775v5 [Chlamydomonas reinhardtii]PNW79131.1 hypothetical protein CHLRE_09g401775v5 [Chlamydomonas reinhardtii]